MSGFSDYSSQGALNWVTGQGPMPAIGSRFLALLTVAPTDAGTGGTEVTGGAYARVQVAGAVSASAAFTTASTSISFASVPAWVVAGMNVYDITAGQQIGTVASVGAGVVNLTGTAAHASSGAADSIQFSAWPAASGSAPSSVTNGAAVSFPKATADWAAVPNYVVAWGIYDAVTGGNLIDWDYLGNDAWMPATVSAASPGVITAHAHGMANGDSFVFSTEYGGTAPTFSAGNYTGIQTAAGVSTDGLDVTGVNTSASGNGMIRKVTKQQIPSGVTFSAAAGEITMSAA